MNAHFCFLLMNSTCCSKERDIPTAEAEAGAGKVLIWKEGVTGHVLVWNLLTEALAQGLREGD